MLMTRQRDQQGGTWRAIVLQTWYLTKIYRPISNLSFLSKIVEIYAWISIIMILRQTPSYAVTVEVKKISLQRLGCNMDSCRHLWGCWSGHVTLLALYDVSKISDTVNHGILLKRIEGSFIFYNYSSCSDLAALRSVLVWQTQAVMLVHHGLTDSWSNLIFQRVPSSTRLIYTWSFLLRGSSLRFVIKLTMLKHWPSQSTCTMSNVILWSTTDSLNTPFALKTLWSS